MRIKNISNGKPIGIGGLTVLPGETKEVPKEYVGNPVLDTYKEAGLISILADKGDKAAADTVKKEQESAATAKADADEKRRQEILSKVDGMNEEEIGQVAMELGINPADCKNQADVVKKIKAALKK